MIGRFGQRIRSSSNPHRSDLAYDQRSLSYAGTFTDPFKSRLIRLLELATGKPRLLRLIRRFEQEGVEVGPAFFDHALQVMGIDVLTPDDEIHHVPATGPCVVVANHPHGLVDGLVLAQIVGRVRGDFKILTRSLLTNVPEVADWMIPVPFPHEANAFESNILARHAAMAHLALGGCIVVFPAGAVAAADSAFGPAVEKPWPPFVAKMIRRSEATVVTVAFKGQNSRAYQIANLISATLRQGLLLHEVVHALDRPQSPVVRPALPPSEWRPQAQNATRFMAWLRARTLTG